MRIVISAFGVALRLHVDPFDCYTDNGAAYNGLHDQAASGEKCDKWASHAEDLAGATLSGNAFNYCRNPGGTKGEPWCFTVTGEEKICAVKKCPEEAKDVEPWVAPEGTKSEGKEQCTYEAPARDHYRKFRDSEERECKKRAETDRVVAQQWLVGNKMEKATDEEDCALQCMGKPGSEYITFYGTADDDGNNCGCFRECIFQDKDLTINSPNSFRLT